MSVIHAGVGFAAGLAATALGLSIAVAAHVLTITPANSNFNGISAAQAAPQAQGNERDDWIRTGREFFSVEQQATQASVDWAVAAAGDYTDLTADQGAAWASQNATIDDRVRDLVQLLPVPPTPDGAAVKHSLAAAVIALKNEEIDYDQTVQGPPRLNKVNADNRLFCQGWAAGRAALMTALATHSIALSDVSPATKTAATTYSHC